MLNLIEHITHLTEEERSYVKNRTSVDFVLFYRQDKDPVLAIEVEGFAFHVNGSGEREK